MGRFIGFVIIAWMFVGCATEPPPGADVDKLGPARAEKYREMGRQAAKRDAAHMEEYNAFLQGEVKAGRLQPAYADQMYRQEWRAIRRERLGSEGTNKGFDCTSMQMGPFTDTTCR